MTLLRRFSETVSIFFFLVTFLAVFGQVIFRYVLNMPVGWAVEVAVNAFLLGSWWTICWNVALRDHVTPRFVVDVQKTAQRLAAKPQKAAST